MMNGYDEAVRRIEEAIEQKTECLNLRKLDLTELPPAIGKLTHLKELDLENNLLTRLPPEIGTFSGLTYLNLAFNRLQELPPELGQLMKLRRLYLQFNELRTFAVEFHKLALLIVLDLSHNPLERWVEHGPPTLIFLNLWNCRPLSYLPDWLQHVRNLNIHNCEKITALPDHLQVRQLTLSGTSLTAVPEGCQNTMLFWSGIQIDERIAFHPETITAEEVLNEANVEVRRVLVERMGYERFIEEAQPEVVDEDTDVGGVRQLLRIEMAGDEPLVCLRVHDPSTGRQYLLRVPPNMATCHQAAAWVAGFDNPDDYRPVMET